MNKKIKSTELFVKFFFSTYIFISGCTLGTKKENVYSVDVRRGENMVTANVIQRTFHIKVGESSGTAFALDVDGRQYLVTAAHVLGSEKKKIDMDIDHKWIPTNIKVVGIAPSPIDIAVFAVEKSLQTENLPVVPISEGTIVSGELFLLGFPYGIPGYSGLTERGYSIPLVKKAICSGFLMGKADEQYGFYLDAINNPGFSGGPVVDMKANPPKVVAIISGYRYQNEPIFNNQGVMQDLYYQYNTGIVVVYLIEHAVNLIKANPIGFRL
jgi:S1-C subfamily serine protease